MGRELSVVGSRLPYGRKEWTPATIFWAQPDRNDHTSALWCDPATGKLYHFNGYSVAATWGPLAVLLRTSDDHGRTWGKARLILPEHHRRQMPVESIFRLRSGSILLPCDAVTGGSGGTAIYLSDDDGANWTDPGGTIAGIHACVAELEERLRRANGMRRRSDIVIGQRVRLDFSRVSRDEFEARRLRYHESIQEAFFADHRVAGTSSHVLRRGDTLWSLSRRHRSVPLWLLRQYNPQVDLTDLQPGVTITIPRVQKRST